MSRDRPAKRSAVACLVPGRVAGALETDPGSCRRDRILLAPQIALDAVAALPAGLILVDAAPLSHPVIRWLGRGIPVALMDAEQAAGWQAGEYVVLDAAEGVVRAGGDRTGPWHPPGPPDLGRPVGTPDGTEIHLCASVSDTGAARRAVLSGAESVGLVRSEYLYPDDAAPPSAAFYRHAFADLLAASAPLTVTVRLLDPAPDKWPPWLPERVGGQGLCLPHGSQLYQDHVVRAVVDAQLAALRDLAPGRLRVLWPSGALLSDFLRSQEVVTRRLPAVPLGAMVESPIEMLALDRWGAAADFVAVGCNDLLGHLCAADRDNPRQRMLLSPYAPALFRFLRSAAERAGPALPRVQLCGLLPQVDGVLAVLIGLGYRRFSVEPALIPLLARDAQRQGVGRCASLAEAVCGAADGAAAARLLGVPAGPLWGLVRGDRAARRGPSAGP
jgi:phosphohistidine swiveling domain-containing protein